MYSFQKAFQRNYSSTKFRFSLYSRYFILKKIKTSKSVLLLYYLKKNWSVKNKNKDAPQNVILKTQSSCSNLKESGNGL